MKVGIAKKNYGIFVRPTQPFPPINPKDGLAIEKNREYHVPDNYDFENGWFEEKKEKKKDKSIKMEEL